MDTNTASVRRVVRAGAAYDLVVTAGFMTPSWPRGPSSTRSTRGSQTLARVRGAIASLLDAPCPGPDEPCPVVSALVT